MTGTGRDIAVRRSPVRRWILLFAFISVVADFAGLGVWQVQRLAWKLDLIERVDARVHAEPVSAPGPERWSEINASQDEYIRVRLDGIFLHDKEVRVVASTERGPGYWVMTPLVRQDGTTVIVNRGFVPNEMRDASVRAAGQIEGPAMVVGLLRISERDSWILRKNDPVADRWYRRDPIEIGTARGLGTVAPFFVDADATPNRGGWPLGGLTRVHFSNSHLIYALTWFALAVMAAIGAFYVVRTEFLATSSAEHSDPAS